LKTATYKLENTGTDLDPLLDRIRDADYVLLGEASHVTSEFYTWRAEVTKRLINERRLTDISRIENCMIAEHWGAVDTSEWLWTENR
jgi:hypothetical protein